MTIAKALVLIQQKIQGEIRHAGTDEDWYECVEAIDFLIEMAKKSGVITAKQISEEMKEY